MNIVQLLREEVLSRLDLGGYISCDGGCVVGDVLKKMRESRVSAVLVEVEGRVAGIFTERDVLTKIADNASVWGHSVAEFMTRDPQSLCAQESIGKALRLMNNGHYRNVQIVDEDGRIEGNLPQHEIIHFLTDQFPKDIYNLPPDPERIPHTKEGA